MSFASFLLREVVIYCLFFFKTSFAAHLSAFATRRLLFTADIVSLSITPRPCLDPTTQWAAAAAPHSFISSPSPSRRQRNCCQQVTHSIKHPIRGYKQNTSYSLIAQAELCASQCYFFPFKQVKEPANRKSVRGLSWFVCFKFMNKWVGFFLHPKCESDAIKSKNTARKQLKKKNNWNNLNGGRRIRFLSPASSSASLISWLHSSYHMCKSKVLYAPMTIICLQFSELRPSRVQPFETVRWNTFFLFCTLIFFLGNMMSKTTFHFRERLFFFFPNIWWLSIFLHKPCWKQCFPS